MIEVSAVGRAGTPDEIATVGALLMGPDGAFVADEVLAKHDEKYMPPEVAASLKQKSASKAPAGRDTTTLPGPTG